MLMVRYQRQYGAATNCLSVYIITMDAFGFTLPGSQVGGIFPVAYDILNPRCWEEWLEPRSR
jgi:hypothetical protein